MLYEPKHLPPLLPYDGRIDPVDGKYFVNQTIKVLYHDATVELMWAAAADKIWAWVKIPALDDQLWLQTAVLDLWNPDLA